MFIKLIINNMMKYSYFFSICVGFFLLLFIIAFSARSKKSSIPDAPFESLHSSVANCRMRRWG